MHVYSLGTKYIKFGTEEGPHLWPKRLPFSSLQYIFCLFKNFLYVSLNIRTVFDVISLSQLCSAIFPMDKNFEERICLKFWIANVISYAESLNMLQKAYGESTLWKTTFYKWHSAFKSGLDELEDLPRSGWPPTSSTEVNIAKIKEMVTENRYLSLREIVAEFSVSHQSIRTILNDCLGMKRVAARLVPKDHLTKLSLWTNFWRKTRRISSNNHHIL